VTKTGEWLRIGVNGVVPVHWDNNASKADTGTGTLSGWASVYNVLDQQDDIVRPGAFAKALRDWRSSGRTIPLVLDHDHVSDAVIGSVKTAEETPYGLKFAAAYSGVPRAQDARQKAREGHLTGLSIFGPIYGKSFETLDGREVRILSELGLTEISLTPFPANQSAMVTAAKNGLVAQVTLDDAWVKDMRAALEISSAAVRKAAVDMLVTAAYQLSAVDPDGEKTAGLRPLYDAVNGGERDPKVLGPIATDVIKSIAAAGGVGTDDESVYALSLIGESERVSSQKDSQLEQLLSGKDPVATAKALSDLDALERELLGQDR
jgi:HK97 family phage prohead protease